MNVHTTAHADGEIRAQVTVQQGTATPTPTATATPKSTATAVPAAPQSGTGGYLDQGDGVLVTILLALRKAALAGVGVQLIRRRK